MVPYSIGLYCTVLYMWRIEERRMFLRDALVLRLQSDHSAREKRRAGVQRDDVSGRIGELRVANARLDERAAHYSHVREHRGLTCGAARRALRRVQTQHEVHLQIRYSVKEKRFEKSK